MTRISASSRPPTPESPSAALRCCPSCSLSVTITRIADIEGGTSPPPRIRPIVRKIRCLRTFFLPVFIIPTKVKKVKLRTRMRISVLLSFFPCELGSTVTYLHFAQHSHPRSSVFPAKVKLSPSFNLIAVACNSARYRANKNHGRAIDSFPSNRKRIHGNVHSSQVIDRNDFGESVLQRTTTITATTTA